MRDLIAKAQKLFQAFHGRKPRANDIRLMDEAEPEPVLRVGKLCAIIYEADGEEGKPYLHDFKTTDRPDLFVSSDGQQAYIVAGRYVFTDRGFVD